MKKRYLLLTLAILTAFLIFTSCSKKKNDSIGIPSNVESVRISQIARSFIPETTNKDIIKTIVDLINSATRTDESINKEMPFIYYINFKDENDKQYIFRLYEQDNAFYLLDESEQVWLTSEKILDILASIFE